MRYLLDANIVARLLDGDFDLVVACTALEHRAVRVTHDGGLKDGAVPGLVVEDWLS